MIDLWFWEYTDEFGKRRRSTWRMTEADAAYCRDAVKVDGTLERRPPGGGSFNLFPRDTSAT